MKNDNHCSLNSKEQKHHHHDENCNHSCKNKSNHDEKNNNRNNEHHHHDDHHHDCCSDCCISNTESCDCGHSHEKDFSKTEIVLWIFSIISFILALMPFFEPIKVGFFILSAVLAGYELFFNGIKEIFKFKLQENSLLLIAVVASFVLGEYPEACIVTILFKLGEFLESYAISRSKKNMEELTKIRPDLAVVKNEHGEYVTIDAKEVRIGDTVYLRAGDKVALDCEVLSGSSDIDSSALTGESIPQYVTAGDTLLSGSINLSGLLCCKVTKDFSNSTASQILEMVYSSAAKKGQTEKFITKFAKYYTPIIVVLAIILAIVPPLLGLGTFDDFIMRSLIFLVASCPCALVISIPLSFFSAIGATSKRGILVKGSMYIETLSKATAVCFDKTGTVTSGKMQVDKIETFDIDEKESLSLLWGLEDLSTHPIAAGIIEYAKTSNVEKQTFDSITEMAGLGVEAVKDGIRYLCGSSRLLEKHKIDFSKLPAANVYLCKNGKVICCVLMKEDIQKDSFTLAEQLKDCGINTTVLLTGDNEANAKKTAGICNFSEYHAGMLPIDKVNAVKEVKERGETVIFVGDGINDAPVIVEADLGISMGLGSQIANVSSDVILASNRLSSLPKAIKLAKRSMGVIRFNIAFALIIKLAVLILGASSYGNMWLAVFADIGVTIIAVINSARILKFKDI